LENTPNGIFWKMPFFIKEKKILEREEKGWKKIAKKHILN
jgi:hypothetical protein